MDLSVAEDSRAASTLGGRIGCSVCTGSVRTRPLDPLWERLDPDDDVMTRRYHAMAEKMVRIMCPNLTCRKVLAVPDVARGKTVRCKGCSTNIRVPEAKSTQPADNSGS